MKTKLKQNRIYLVGIKGVAMTALACYLKEEGFTVSGSDTDERFPTSDILEKLKIKIDSGFKSEYIDAFLPDMVVYTGAHDGADNPMVRYATGKQILSLPHGKALGMIMKSYRQITVAGCHGKTTTSALTAKILTGSAIDISYAIGSGEIKGLGLPGHAGKSLWFLAEGDEYVTDPKHDFTPRFLWQQPEILVITNIDYDHPDVYKNMIEIQAAYQKLVNKIKPKGLLIINGDDMNCRQLKPDCRVIRVGFGRENDFVIKSRSTTDGIGSFEISDGKTITRYRLSIPGRHNIHNAALALVASFEAGAGHKTAGQSLIEFGGAKRRFEKIGETNKIRFYDDYAHHPCEIQSTLKAAREWFEKSRIIAVFQPHTYTRTQILLDEFGKSFGDAGVVLLTDIYASARESNKFGFKIEQLVDRVSRNHPNTIYSPDRDKTLHILDKTLRAGDVVIFMGAGDIYNWGRQIYEDLAQKYA